MLTRTTGQDLTQRTEKKEELFTNVRSIYAGQDSGGKKSTSGPTSRSLSSVTPTLHWMIPFPNLPPNVYPIFPVKPVVTAKKTRLNRKQIGITPGFAYTEYKIQGATSKSAVLDLRRRPKKKKKKDLQRITSDFVPHRYVAVIRTSKFGKAQLSLQEPIQLVRRHKQPRDNQPHQLHGNLRPARIWLFSSETTA